MDVMLSVHCATMLNKAQELKVYLNLQGYTVFLCNQMNPGDDFRKIISMNAAACKVMVLFMNSGWCNSAECEYEFNIALRTRLTNNGVPLIIPLLLEPFAFYKSYPTIHGFLCTTNGLVVEALDIDVWSRIETILKESTNSLDSSMLNSAIIHRRTEKRKNVLVFGPRNTGKTKLIEYLTAQDATLTDDFGDLWEVISPTQCTSSCEIEFSGYLWSFVDGGNLLNSNEWIDQIRIPAHNTLQNQSFILFDSQDDENLRRIKEFKKREGDFDFLLMVMNANMEKKEIDSALTNYHLARFAHKRTPIVFVITGCEAWEHEDVYDGIMKNVVMKYSLECADIIPTCFADGKEHAELRRKSIEDLWSSIQKIDLQRWLKTNIK